jgi:hypothetical protein
VSRTTIDPFTGATSTHAPFPTLRRDLRQAAPEESTSIDDMYLTFTRVGRHASQAAPLRVKVTCKVRSPLSMVDADTTTGQRLLHVDPSARVAVAHHRSMFVTKSLSRKKRTSGPKWRVKNTGAAHATPTSCLRFPALALRLPIR